MLFLLMALQAATTPGRSDSVPAADSIPRITLGEAIRRSTQLDPDYVRALGQMDDAEWGRRAAVLAFVLPSVQVGLDETKYSQAFFNPANPGDFGFVNSDLAFEGNNAFVGNFNGFQIYDISNPSNPVLRTAVACPGGQGEVLYRSPQLCTGYWDKPEETEEAFAGGWFHSGDLVRIDEEGYLFVVDRVKDVINTGGVLVASREVEEALYSHPAVAEVAVIGTPHRLPCMRSHSHRPTSICWSSVSTPSATTRAPMRPARPAMDSRKACRRSSAWQPCTKCRSIFR